MLCDSRNGDFCSQLRFHGNGVGRLNRHNSSADVKGLFQPTVRWLFQLIDANDTGEEMHWFRRANNRCPSNGVQVHGSDVFPPTNLLSGLEMNAQAKCDEMIRADK